MFHILNVYFCIHYVSGLEDSDRAVLASFWTCPQQGRHVGLFLQGQQPASQCVFRSNDQVWQHVLCYWKVYKYTSSEKFFYASSFIFCLLLFLYRLIFSESLKLIYIESTVWSLVRRWRSSAVIRHSSTTQFLPPMAIMSSGWLGFIKSNICANFEAMLPVSKHWSLSGNTEMFSDHLPFVFARAFFLVQRQLGRNDQSLEHQEHRVPEHVQISWRQRRNRHYHSQHPSTASKSRTVRCLQSIEHCRCHEYAGTGKLIWLAD